MSVIAREHPVAMANRVAGYAKASAIVWMILAIIQILIGLAEWPTLIIIGIWNIIASIQGFKLAGKIRMLDPSTPDDVEGLAGLIIFGIVNVLLGAILGIAGIILDFYVRDQILKNRDLFSPEYAPPPPAYPQAVAYAYPVAVAATAPAQPQPRQDAYDALFKLGELKQRGFLTEAEFAAEKNRLLGIQSTVPAEETNDGN